MSTKSTKAQADKPTPPGQAKKEDKMETMEVDQRVVPKANPNFVGTVTRANPDGLSGYVHFDLDEEPGQETFYSASELDPAPPENP